MKTFKVGDKVVRTGKDYKGVKKGGIYVVSEVSKNANIGSCGINLKGHEVEGMGKFNYESSCFDLYIDDVLSPLEAAEALMNKDKLQVFDSDANKWYGFHNELRNITLEDLKHIKLRHKPKTVVINGVEVPAPLKTLAGRKSAFYIDLFRKSVTETLMPYDIKDEIMWATKEDAQKVLDAMLISFKESNDD